MVILNRSVLPRGPDQFEQNQEIALDPDVLFIIYVPFLALGLLSNMVVVWIWSSFRMRHVFYNTIYLFKALALSDILHLAMFYPARFEILGFHWRLFFRNVSYGNHVIAVYITLLLAVVRFVQVFNPRQAFRILSEERVRVSVEIIVIACVVFQASTSSLRVFVIEGNWDHITVPLKIGVGHSLPALIQSLLMLFVLCKQWRSRREKLKYILQSMEDSVTEKPEHSTRRFQDMVRQIMSWVELRISKRQGETGTVERRVREQRELEIQPPPLQRRVMVEIKPDILQEGRGTDSITVGDQQTSIREHQSIQQQDTPDILRLIPQTGSEIGAAERAVREQQTPSIKLQSIKYQETLGVELRTPQNQHDTSVTGTRLNPKRHIKMEPRDSECSRKIEPRDSPCNMKTGPNNSPYDMKTGPKDNPCDMKTGPKDSPYGLKTEQKNIPNGSKTEPKDSPNGSKTEPKDSRNGSKTEPKDSPYGLKTEPKYSPFDMKTNSRDSSCDVDDASVRSRISILKKPLSMARPQGTGQRDAMMNSQAYSRYLLRSASQQQAMGNLCRGSNRPSIVGSVKRVSFSSTTLLTSKPWSVGHTGFRRQIVPIIAAMCFNSLITHVICLSLFVLQDVREIRATPTLCYFCYTATLATSSMTLFLYLYERSFRGTLVFKIRTHIIVRKILEYIRKV